MLATVVRTINRASSIEDIQNKYPILNPEHKQTSENTAPTPRRISNMLEGVVAAAAASETSPSEAYRATRSLLQLASLQVTANLLSCAGSAGKKVRQLKRHPHCAVANAAGVTVQAWRFCIAPTSVSRGGEGGLRIPHL